MMKDFNVDIEPEVIEWIIKSSGYTVENLSEQLGIDKNTIKKWIEGKKKPTINEIEDLAKYLKRPLAAFFLSKPPEEKPLPIDYRMIRRKDGIFDPETILAIRTARRLQKISKELIENLNYNITPLISFVKILEDPKKIAKEYRNKFQITEEIQKKWKDPNKAFNVLRELIEKQNILVFQFPMSIKDVGGFTLSEDAPPVLVVNSKDQIKRRIFTLMHEFGHIVLRKPGIDMPENTLFILNSVDDVEKWCNEFASEFLLPENMAKELFDKNKNTLTETETLNRLSNDYKVSKAMLLYNMKKLGYITDIQCKEVLERPQKEKNENYLFTLEDIPGKDNARILDYLVKSLKIDWAKNAEISKSNDAQTILVKNGKNLLELKVNEKKGGLELLLEIGGKKLRKLRLKKEGDKTKVYKIGGGPSPDTICISRKGKKFISLVSANVKNKFITDVDAFDYLSIKSKQYDKVLQKING